MDKFPADQPHLDDAKNLVRMKWAEAALFPGASAGQRAEALQLVELLASVIESGSPVASKAMRKWLGQSLLRIGLGDSVEIAFGIPKRGKGQTPERDARRERQTQYRRADLVERLRKLRGLSVEQAIAKVSEQEHISEGAVRKAWEAQHRLAKRELDLEARHLGRIFDPWSGNTD